MEGDASIGRNFASGRDSYAGKKTFQISDQFEGTLTVCFSRIGLEVSVARSGAPVKIKDTSRAHHQWMAQHPQCHSHYTLRPHPLSFDGRLPIAPICVLNWTPELQSIHVADFAERILRMRAGEEDCKTCRLVPASSPDLMLRQQMTSRELRNEIIRHKDPGISNMQFEQYWSMALNELYRRSDKIEFGRRDEYNADIIEVVSNEYEN
ncbi:inner nuclear membrane protein enriched at telomere/subtelomere region [Podila horticola]|nr:inner nuclear membrane protein enriched at telomere/subtelomere region [Podila horticola]